MKKNPPLNPTRGVLLSCNLTKPGNIFFPVISAPKFSQGTEALGSGFSIALWGPRNQKNGLYISSYLWKTVNFQTFWSYLFCLIHWLTFSTFPAQSQGVLLISFTIFLPGKKINCLHWGWNHIPKMMVTLPGDTIKGWRSGQRKRCPHVADKSTVPPMHWFDKLKNVLINI